MKIHSRFLLATAILAVTATSAESQVSLHAGATHAEALGGQWGADARLGYNFIALPVEVFAGADYFLAGCEEDCGLWGWRLGGDLRFPIPGATPYVTGAWVHRERELGTVTKEKEGIALGVGISVDFGFRIRAEVCREFLGGDLEQLVFRVGLGL
jgi:hypothetical protein